MPNLALPDPLHTAAYRLEIVSAVLQGSGTIHSTKISEPAIFVGC